MLGRALLFTMCVVAPFLAWASPVHTLLDTEFHRRVFFRGAHFPDFHLVRGQMDVAVYDGPGSWDAGKEGFKKFLIDRGIGYRIITPGEISSGQLVKEQFRALFMPGGESWQYLDEIGETGAEKIRNFVARGGGYLGICAGAFYATSQREGGVSGGNYGIGLLEGVAIDGTAEEVEPFREGEMEFRVGARAYHWLMLGGPSFRYSAREAREKQIRILARIPSINQPAIVTLQYGLGRVFLSAPHLEVDPGTIDSFELDASIPRDNGRRMLERGLKYVLQR